MRLIGAAALLLACAAASAGAQTPAGAAAPTWKQIYENSQTTFYVDAASPRQSGRRNVMTLLEYKVPQVIGGAQVWSIVSHIQLSCDENRLVTTDNTFFASKMGAGRAIQTQPASDSWHQPEPGSLGALIWDAACGKP